jgi:5-methylthioribose kinase
VTHEENNKKSLLITKTNGDGYDIVERIPFLPSGLYYIYIKLVSHVVYKVIFQNVDAFQIWHDRLGHPGVGMMRKILGNCTCHNLNKFSKTSDFICTACATGKLILGVHLSR